uniref:DNA-directed RNA polymerase n=5 Tax=unclassified Termitomyces TaxID=2634893 RepID=A0A8H2S9V2_9AGAR|nr:RNA polymerase [Termitomyces sp. T28]QWO71415.1 RNA polymerase [Termitomyces sp. T60a]QWO71420.1 RNA polymerase [Termitomyces sp. T99]QWO71421.1 RNA polymerase [Termitomyces sp. T132]QWO71424.1 RNA polymerase [Termitomyces sp. T8]
MEVLSTTAYLDEFMLNVLCGNKIIGCFARSYDESHIKSERIHLVSSIIGLSQDSEIKKEENLRLEYLKGEGLDPNYFENWSQLEVFLITKENSFFRDVLRLESNYNEFVVNSGIINCKYLYIFHLIPYKEAAVLHKIYETTSTLRYDNNDCTVTFSGDNLFVVRRNSYVISIFCSLDEFVGKYHMKRGNELLDVIFGDYSDKEKNNELIWQNSLFIFYNYMWSNIVLNFKLNGIDISGGSISKRHVLKTVQFELHEKLGYMYKGFNIHHILHSSLSDPCLSSTIPLKEYKKCFKKMEESIAFSTWKRGIHELVQDVKLKDIKLELGKSYKNKLVDMMMHNYLITARFLYVCVIKSFESIINKIKEELLKNENEKRREILTLKVSSKEEELLRFKNNFVNMDIKDIVSIKERLEKEEGKEKEVLNIGTKYIKTPQNNIRGVRNYSSVRTCNKILVEDINDLDNLREEFLKVTSNFGVEMKKIVNQVNTAKTEEEKYQIQKQIENYCVQFEEDYVDNIIKNSDSENKYDPLVVNLFLDLNDKLVKALDNFTHEYEINNYERLIKEIKINNGKGELFLLILALKFKIKEKNKKIEARAKEYSAKLSNIRKITRDQIIYERYSKYIKCESTSIVSRIIYILVNMISNYKVYDKDNDTLETWNISLANLKHLFGEAFIKRAPKELPSLFFECDSIWKEKDIEIITNFYKNNIKNVSEETIFTIGSCLFELIVNSVDIFQIYGPIFENGKRNKYVRIKDSYIADLSLRLVHPNKLPMVINPVKWEKNKKTGGFLNYEYNNIINSNLIHKNRRNLGESSLTVIQTDTINFLNAQVFKINKVILTFLLKEFKKENSLIFKGKNFSHPDTSNFCNLDLDQKKKVSAHNSKFNLYKNILTLAVIFEDVNFYIPTYFDFRGRIYSVVDYLNYQGEDISRGLIEFSNGCVLDINNVLYVLQYLANTSGKSKLTVLNKTKWAINIINNLNILKIHLTINNLEEIFNFNNFKVCDIKLEELINNYYIKELLLDNEDKLQFLGTLLSLIKNLLNRNLKFCTPICFDATCSGFQHLSAIFLDVEMAITSNVADYLIKAEELESLEEINKEDINNLPKKNEPRDVYSQVAETVIKKINIVKDISYKEKLLKLNINRNLLKRPVMTIPYNVGLNTMGQQLISAGFFSRHTECMYKEKDTISSKICYFYSVSPNLIKEEFKGDIITFTNSEMGKFFSMLYSAVYETFPSLKKYIEYLNKFADIFGKLNAPIIWTTPVGMRIELRYKEFKTKKGKSLYDSKKRNSVSLPIPGKIDHKANKLSLLPNFIHSMDSANIQLLVHNLTLNNNNINLFTIHDCFATTPNTMRILNLEVRRAFSLMYFDEIYLKKLHLEFIREISNYEHIYKEDSDGNETSFDLLSCYENYRLFIFINSKKKKEERVKLYLPNLPFKFKWEVVKEIFEKGISNSLYFIN